MKIFYKISIVFSMLILLSCSRNSEEIPENFGVKTSLTGFVKNEITGQPVENYKIKLIKGKNVCANWACGWSSTEVKTVLTDKNGHYSIDFLYKLEQGEIYGLEEQYYGNPYVSVYQQSNGIAPGINNVININVWQPIKIVLNATVKNNNIPPVIIGNKLAGTNNYLFNVENFYEHEITKTVTLLTKPNSNIVLYIWYNENYNSSSPIRHLKTQSIKTESSDLNLTLNIDCATF